MTSAKPAAKWKSIWQCMIQGPGLSVWTNGSVLLLSRPSSRKCGTYGEAYDDLVGRAGPNADHVPENGVDIVRDVATSTLNNEERMLSFMVSVKYGSIPEQSNTYSVQMEGVRSANRASVHGDLYRLVQGQGLDTIFGHEVVCVVRSAEDLEEHRDRRGGVRGVQVRGVVHKEVRAILYNTNPLGPQMKRHRRRHSRMRSSG